MKRNPIPTDSLMRALGSVPDDTILVLNSLGNLGILNASLDRFMGYVDLGPGFVEVWLAGMTEPQYREDHGAPSEEERWGDRDA